MGEIFDLDNLHVVNPHIKEMTLLEYIKMKNEEYAKKKAQQVIFKDSEFSRVKEDAMHEIVALCYNNGAELPDMDSLALAMDA